MKKKERVPNLTDHLQFLKNKVLFFSDLFQLLDRMLRVFFFFWLSVCEGQMSLGSTPATFLKKTSWQSANAPYLKPRGTLGWEGMLYSHSVR